MLSNLIKKIHTFSLHWEEIVNGSPDEDMTRTKGKEPLKRLGGPMIWARTKKVNETL